MKIAILGTGSWPTALSQLLVDNGHETMMYGINKNEIDDINLNHQNSYFFKDVTIDHRIKATSSLQETLKDASYILITVPTSAVRSILESVKPYLTNKVTLINASKGFDLTTNKRISETIREVLDETDFDEDELVTLINKKYGRYLADEKGVAKTINGLLRMGYSYGEIRNALKTINENIESDEEVIYE